MPELPEVETVKNGLLPLVNQHFTKIRIINPKLRWPVDPHLADYFLNTPIRAVSRRAKYLCLHVDQRTMIIHLGMSGALYMVSQQDPVRKHEHLIFTLSGGNELRYQDVRRFGSVHMHTGDIHAHKLFKHLGPEPLDATFDASWLHAQLRKHQSAIKSRIMNQTVVVGVGNIYASEALYASRIHPKRTAHSLSLDETQRLVACIKHILTRAIRQGGTTLRDFINPDAKPGYFQQKLQVYGRQGKPCNACGQPIDSEKIAQRSTFFCPSCQPLSSSLSS